MANAREIRERINSVEDTRKITNAMYMISSTKLKKSRRMLADTEPYFYALQTLIQRTLRHMPDGFVHSYFNQREELTEEERCHGLIVVTGDKGLAGAYNHNVFKAAEEWMARYPRHKLYVVGELGRQYFAAHKVEVEQQFHYTVQNPSMHRARLISLRVEEDYENHRIDDVTMLYTKMVNAMTAETETEKLLPLEAKNFSSIPHPAGVIHEDIRLVPSPQVVMDNIVPNYVSGFIFGALVESFCSEQNARMMAMQSATDNANKLIAGLSQQYNRVRQAAITQEITEVISGAKAQKKRR